MKNLSRITYAASLIVALLVALALGGGVSVNSSASSTSAPADSPSVASSAPATATSGNSSNAQHSPESSASADTSISVEKDGSYTDKDHVALYIHTYGTVPSNYVTKSKARKAGWLNTKGNLWDVLPGMSIGGGGFYNDDGMLPDASGREWFECDIDYEGGFRNAKRIVYSNDGLIYYTDDHYETFERLY